MTLFGALQVMFIMLVCVGSAAILADHFVGRWQERRRRRDEERR